MKFSKGLVLTVFTLASLNGGAQIADAELEHELNLLYQKQLAAEKMIQDQQGAKLEVAQGQQGVQPELPQATEPQAQEPVTPVSVAAPVGNDTPANQANTKVGSPVNQTTVEVETTPSPSAVSTVKEAPVVFQSPSSQIEAAPLAPSRADQLRKARQEVEVQTEQAIAEQLEASRLEWERKRSEALLKNIQKVNGATEAEQNTLAAQPAPAVVPVGPEASAATSSTSATNNSVANTEIAQMKEELKAISADLKAQNEKPKDDNYFSFGIGLPSYRNVFNVKPDASFGFGMGFRSPNNVVFEASLYYSLIRIERPTTSPWLGVPEIDNVDQVNGIGAVKYAFFSGKVRPLIGALASYTYREYSCGQFYVCNGKTRTYGLDAGLLVGGEVQVSDTFSVGVEYQQLRNLSYRTEASVQPSMFFAMYPLGRLEDQEYSLFTVRGRVSF